MAVKTLVQLADKATYVTVPARIPRVIKVKASPQTITLTHIIRQEKAR